VTRLSDVDAGISVADPGKQPARSPSAPEGLVGHYSETSLLRDSPNTQVIRVALQTMCVRNSNQCTTFKSYLVAGTTVVSSLLFDNGKWLLDEHTDINCSSGAATGTVIRQEYPLPQPVSNPLPRLTGHARIDAAGPCPAQELDISLERTGD
jgi:hypothetical protein